jgi:hypothetical protein
MRARRSQEFAAVFKKDQFPASGLQHVDRPLCHLFSALQTHGKLTRSDFSPAVDLLGSCEYLPDDSSDLIGQRDDHLISMHALFKLRHPRPEWMSLPIAGLHAGSGAVDQ